MKVHFTLLIIITLCGCSSPKNHIVSNDEKAWVNTFKDKTFVSCLKESYCKNDSIFKMIDKIDLYNPYDGFYTINSFIMRADSLGRNISKQIPPTNYKDYGKSNYYMATCLHYYSSKELDSIAKAEYKKYLKERNEN